MGLGLLQVAGFGLLVVVFAVVLFVIFLVGSAVRLINEYERASSSGSVGCRARRRVPASSSSSPYATG